MAATPTRSKAVSFKVPGSKPSTPGALDQFQRSSAKSSPQPTPPTSEHVNENSTPTAQHGAQPDLVADIVDVPKTANPRKLVNLETVHEEQDSQPGSRSGSAVKALMEKQEKQISPSTRRHYVGGRVYCRPGTRTFANTTSTRDRSPLLDQQKYKSLSMTTTEAAQLASQIRGVTNSSNHEHIRALKYDAARLRENLLKVEEEVKNLNRGRSTLELAIQDVRRALSVNQQSISTQQKKSSRGEEVMLCYCKCSRASE